MHITHFVYKYGDMHKTIDMIVTSTDDKGQPMGYEVWEQSTAAGKVWIVDDEPTIITNPIESQRDQGRILRMVT